MEDSGGVVSPAELAARISDLVSRGSSDEALALLKEDKFRECVEGNSWELIPVLTRHLSQATLVATPRLFNCARDLLHEVACRSNPKEVLIGLLEEAEDTENDVKFSVLLEPLKIVLFRFPSKQAQSLELCLEVIASHLASLPLPDNHALEGEERVLLDADPCVQRITNIYSEVVAFLEPFVTDISTKNHESRDIANSLERNLLINHVLLLLGKPLAYLDMDCEKTASASRNVAEKLLSYLSVLVRDLSVFLEVIEDREAGGGPGSSSSGRHGVHSGVETVSFAMLYFLVLGEGVSLDSFPCVYDLHYVFHRVLHLSGLLLRQSSHALVLKGLILAASSLSRMPEGGVPADVLDCPNHRYFAEALCGVLVYSELKGNRVRALEILKMYLSLFDDKGRYLLLCNLPDVCSHDGVMELLVVTFKDMILEANRGGNARSRYFVGGNLTSLLLSLCSLADGVETDLVDSAKQVLASLSLVRFLVLYDKNGLLGMGTALPLLERRLLAPLKLAITLSRAHFELKLKQLKEERADETRQGVSVTVCGETLPCLPAGAAESVLTSTLGCLDLIEFSLSQVNDCISEYRSKP